MDFPKRIDRWFGKTSWTGLAVLLAAGAISFGLMDTLIARPNPELAVGRQAVKDKSARLVKRWRDREDPRGFVEPGELDLPEDQYGIAWISASSISIRGAKGAQQFRGKEAYELTDVLADTVSRVNGRPAYVHEYMIQGARTGDLRRAIMHASSDPEVDALLVPLNSVWLFNPWLQYTKSNQRTSVLLQSGVQSGDWIQAFKFTRPSAIVATHFAGISSITKNRYALSKHMPNADTLSFPFVAKPDVAKVRYARLDKFYPKQNFSAPESMKRFAGYRKSFLQQDLSHHGQGATFLKMNVRTLAKSGKPVIMYITPLPREMQDDPVALEFLEQYKDLLREIVERDGADNLILATYTATESRDPIAHKDVVHLHDGYGLLEEIYYLLDEAAELDVDYVTDEDMTNG